MKKIDNRFRHLPEAEAIDATNELRLREAAPEAIKAEMKADDNGPKQEREAFIKKDRRNFMGLIAKSGIAAGLIRSSALLGGILANRHALAETDVNKRVVYVYINSGSASGSWLPSSATQMNQVTVPYGPQGYNVSDICHFREVNVIKSGHQATQHSLGNIDYSTPTMDKRIADVLGTSTQRKLIYLGAEVYVGSPQGKENYYCSSSGPVTNDPATALSSIFSGGGGGGGGGDNTYELVYNAQLRALESIKSKLSTEEVVRYQEHTESINKIKTAMASSSTPSTTCNSSGLPVANSHIQETGRSQADIIVAALACGITKVATLQLGNHQGEWKGHNTAYTQIDHDAAHSTGGEGHPEAFIELQRYISDVPAYLIKKLRSTNGPDGRPLITSTVVVQVSCMGNGMNHTPANGPFIVATQMPGFRPGFSASVAGDVLDFNGAIPKALSLTGINLGSGNTLGLI